MHKYRSFVLPIAIILGLIFHNWCGKISVIVPFLIFLMLLLNFAAVNVRKLHFSWLFVWLMLFQIVVSLGSYYLLRWLNINNVVAEGVLVSILCPVASSVVVIACMLGADRETVTAYSIWGNLMVAAVAPVYFSFIGRHQDMPFLESFWQILCKISPIIILPFFIILLLQFCLPKVNHWLSERKGWAFYFWAVALLLVLGKTFDFLFVSENTNIKIIIDLAIAAMIICAIQFAVGKLLGKKYGDTIAGGQLLGQKNTAFGIWMSNVYLNPMSSLCIAFYAIWQNLFNSWQLWRHDHKE